MGPRLADVRVAKDASTALARDVLPKKMGDKYSQVVNCLTCLDKNNLDFGDESELGDYDCSKIYRKGTTLPKFQVSEYPRSPSRTLDIDIEILSIYSRT